MGTVNLIFVKQLDDHLVVLAHVPGIEITWRADNVLEGIRGFVNLHYGARVHALGWTYAHTMSTEDPFLVLHVDELGRLIPQETELFEPFAASIEQIKLPQQLEPWSRPSWLLDMERWARKTINAAISVSQIRIGSTGTVLRIASSLGRYYMKSIPRRLAREVLLLQLLNEKMPDACARMFSVRPDENTHVTYEIAGTPLSFAADTGMWKAAIRGLAQFQIQSIAHVEAMLSIGVPYCSLSDLHSGLRGRTLSLVNSQKNSPGELDPNETERVTLLIERATQDCEILSKCRIPETLINNDLNQSNIFVSPDGTTRFIDWTFSRISHPFFTLHGTLIGLDETDRGPTLDHDTLVQEYLSPWQRFSRLDRLIEGFRAASRLTFVQVALNVVELSQVFQDIGPRAFSSVLRQSLRAYNLTPAIGLERI